MTTLNSKTTTPNPLILWDSFRVGRKDDDDDDDNKLTLSWGEIYKITELNVSTHDVLILTKVY